VKIRIGGACGIVAFVVPKLVCPSAVTVPQVAAPLAAQVALHSG
jgi:hypothetical protein